MITPIDLMLWDLLLGWWIMCVLLGGGFSWSKTIYALFGCKESERKENLLWNIFFSLFAGLKKNIRRENQWENIGPIFSLTSIGKWLKISWSFLTHFLNNFLCNFISLNKHEIILDFLSFFFLFVVLQVCLSSLSLSHQPNRAFIRIMEECN